MKNQYFKTIVLSFYSAPAYKNALENWRGFGLKYFFLLTFATSVITSLGWAWSLLKINPEHTADTITGFILSEPDLTFEENITRFFKIFRQIPKLKLENGEVFTTAPMPYSITDPISGYDVAIIDTTGKYKTLEGTDAELLITKNSVVIRNQHGAAKAKEKVYYLHDITRTYSVDEREINNALLILAQIPPLGLRGGKFFTEDDKLYTVLDSKGALLAHVGPEAKLSDKTLEPMLAINNDEIAFKSAFTPEVTRIESSYITEDTMYSFFKLVAAKVKSILLVMIPIIGLPVILLSSFVFGLLMLLFYTTICYSFIRIMKYGPFDFKQASRITAVAITPMQIIGVMLPSVLPSQGTVYFLITIGYLYFAIKSVTRG